MTAPRPTHVMVDGATRIRVAALTNLTPQQARAYALALLDEADLADEANGVSPKAAAFVPATIDGIDGEETAGAL